jgi:hypothetical protein
MKLSKVNQLAKIKLLKVVKAHSQPLINYLLSEGYNVFFEPLHYNGIKDVKLHIFGEHKIKVIYIYYKSSDIYFFVKSKDKYYNDLTELINDLKEWK